MADLATKYYEHYCLGISLGRMEFFGEWFKRRLPGIYPSVQSAREWILEPIPVNPSEDIIKECRENIEKYFEHFKRARDMSAERAAALRTLHGAIRDRYRRYLKNLSSGQFKLMDETPKEIKNDIIEAIIAYKLGCFKASVGMARRALQSALSRKGVKAATLDKQINEAVKNGIIPKKDATVAHSTRKLGNWGLHPQEDGLDDLDDFDTKNVLEATCRIINNAYTED